MSSTICRLCLSTDGEMFEISSENCDAAEKYFYCTSEKLIPIEDCPNHICHQCKDSLGLCYTIIRQWRLINARFLQKGERKSTNKNVVDTLIKEWELFEDYGNKCPEQLDINTMFEEAETEGFYDLTNLLEECFDIDVFDKNPIEKEKEDNKNPTETNTDIDEVFPDRPLQLHNTSDACKKKTKKDRSKVCNICGNTVQNMIYHMRIHTGERPFRCNSCDKCFIQRNALRHHLLVHSGERPYFCKVCGKSFTHPTHLKKHAISIHKVQSNVAIKEICRVDSQKLPQLKETPSFKCPHCDKCFNRNKALQHHFKCVHDKTRRFMCDVCGNSYIHEAHLNCHQTVHNGNKPYTCNICRESFGVSQALSAHIKTHGQNRQLKCNICDNLFFTKSSLMKHTRTHAACGSHKCDECGKAFTTLANLTSHQIVHTNNS